MRLHPGRLGALILLIFAFAGPLRADAADRSHPVVAATGFLKAFGARDALAMAEVADPGARDMLAEIAAKGEAAPAWREVFGGWRHAAAAGWDGNFGEMRTKTFGGGKTYVMLPYHVSDEGWIGVLMLLQNDAGWYVDDIEKWTSEDYRKEPLASF